MAKFRPLLTPMPRGAGDSVLQRYLQREFFELAQAANSALSPVVIASAALHDTLRFNGTNWVNTSYLQSTGAAVLVGGEKNAQVKWSTAAPSGTAPDGTIWVQY